MDALKISRSLVNAILTQAQNTPNAEICGLIAGKNGTPSRCYPVANIANDPTIRYQMSPEGQINALRQIRESGETLIAIYHSHPNATAQPSATDIAEAQYPEAAYLIVSLNTQGVLEMAAFQIKDGQTATIALELE